MNQTNTDNDQRKELAKKLRFAAVNGTANPLSTLKEALGLSSGHTYRDVFLALAAAIDPDGGK